MVPGELKLVSRIIASNLGTRVCLVTQGGFDDHAQEAIAHPKLMKDLGDAVAAFYQDMTAQGKADQVLLMASSAMSVFSFPVSLYTEDTRDRPRSSGTMRGSILHGLRAESETMRAAVAPCAACGLHHLDRAACSVALALTNGMQLARPTGALVAGRYRILNQIHRGPMSTVYRVVDLARGETAMVLKELVFASLPPSERAEALTWFLREAHLLSTLRHRSLPALHASFSDQDRSYLVMEAVPGPSLEMRARYHRPTEDQVLRWGVEICEVLHYLHHQPEPVIYRDLKPANILERADTGELVLVDFGVARRATPGVEGTAVGTPGYAAPEQYQGLADARSDIYALGATLHRLLTGYNPDQEQPFRLPPVRALRPDVRPSTEALIARALALAPSERFAGALEMRDALRVSLPASNEMLQAVAAPFYFWITILPGVTGPLSLVSLHVARGLIGPNAGSPSAELLLLIAVYLPALLYLGPLLGLRRRRIATPGPNTRLAEKKARNLLLTRLGIVLPFWCTIVLAMANQQAGIGFLLPVALIGAGLCWALSIWRAGQAPMPRLLPGPTHLYQRLR